MRKITFLFVLTVLLCNCEEESFDKLNGTWKLIKIYDLSSGNVIPETENQRLVKYSNGGERIQYDYLGNETSRCEYTSTETIIEIFGTEITGEKWSSNYEYWFVSDTLKIRHDGGFEFYDEFFIRVD